MNSLAADLPPILPCTPLEAPGQVREGATYLDYWPDQLAAHPDLTGAVDLAQSTLARTQLIRNPGKVVSPRHVQRWDERLGSFNHMREGMADLLLGAAFILRANNRQGGVRRVLYRDNAEDTTDEFLDAADRLEDLRGQQPNSMLLLAGQLVCKAAWAYDDLDRREDLLGMGARMYRRVYEADKPWDDTKFKASQYLADYLFHDLSTRIRQSRHDHEDVAPLQEEAVHLLDWQGDTILQQCYQEGSLRGEIFEPFSSYIVRNEIYLDPDIKGNHPEIRTSYTSEDNPAEPKEREVDSKFDLVLGRFTSNGTVIGAEAWQTKTGRYAPDQRERPYHPAIKVIVGEGISKGTMIDVVRGLKRANAGEDCTRQVTQISRARELFRPLIARPQKAA